MNVIKFRGLLAACTALAIGMGAHTSFADAGHGDAKKIGKPGKDEAASRTIEVKMYDSYYEPKSLTIKEGETVRFIVHNRGELVHEFNIATHDMHMAHASEMMKMMESGSMGPGMHDDPNSVLLEPGKSGEIIWTFPRHAKLEFACNVPGHYEAGMHGTIRLSH